MPDSGSTIKSVYVDLIPCDSPTHGFQNRRELFTTRLRTVYFRSASLPTPDRYSLSGFLPFDPNRLVPAPWKGSTVGRIGNTSDKVYPRGQTWIQYLKNIPGSQFARPPQMILFFSYFSLSSHLKLWWINFKELFPDLQEFNYIWKRPDSSQDTQTTANTRYKTKR
jgi:hypothetical protein